MERMLRLVSVDYGRSKNWLVFKCYVPSCDVNKEYTIEFCGTELNADFGLVDSANEQLLEMFNLDFGYAPYDLFCAKKKLKDIDMYSWKL